MKKTVIFLLIAALAIVMTACNVPTQTATPEASATATPTQKPLATLPNTPFQDLASLDLVRDVVSATADKVVFGYKYAESYAYPAITNFEYEEVKISGEDMQYTVITDKSQLTVDGTEYIILLEVNGSFEEWEIYPFINKLTVTFDGGKTSSITDFFSYECEEFA